MTESETPHRLEGFIKSSVVTGSRQSVPGVEVRFQMNQRGLVAGELDLLFRQVLVWSTESFVSVTLSGVQLPFVVLP